MKTRATAFAMTMGLAFSLLLAAGQGAIPVRTAHAETVTGQMVVNKAMQYLHYPYAYTGSSPKTGFSCIGLVWYVFQSLGIDMPGDLTDAMAKYPQIRESQLEPGDIVFFKNTWWKGVSHVAIYIGHGKVIHAENPQRGVNISAIRNDPNEGNYWQQHYLVAERPLSSNNNPPSTGGGTHISSWVTVDVSALNLRSAPSLNATVETVLTNGARLGVVGSTSGWYNVRTASHVFGWVDQGGVTGAGGPTRNSRSRKGTPAVVSVTGLHVHQEPSTGAVILDTLSLGQRVRVLKQTSGWDKVKVAPGIKGWSVSWGLKVEQARQPSGHHRQATGKSYAVTAGVRIHSAPSLTASVVAYTEPGMTVRVLGSRSGFAHVETSAKLTGWMDTAYVDGFDPNHGATKKHGHHRRHSHPRGTLTITAHLRTQPSLSATIVEWVQAGTSVSVLKTVPNWDHVRLSIGHTGYIWSAYVKTA